MNVAYINPFISSATSVLATMLSCRLVRGELCLLRDVQQQHEISGIIGLSGEAIGTVTLSLDREVALSAAEAMLGERPESIDADVVDAIGELVNMIAGSAKAQLEEYRMSVSLPNVIVGRNHTVQFPSSSTPICIPFDSDWGPLCVIVGLVAVAETAESTAGRQLQNG